MFLVSPITDEATLGFGVAHDSFAFFIIPQTYPYVFFTSSKGFLGEVQRFFGRYDEFMRWSVIRGFFVVSWGVVF